MYGTYIRIGTLVCSRALECDEFMATLVNDETADYTTHNDNETCLIIYICPRITNKRYM